MSRRLSRRIFNRLGLAASLAPFAGRVLAEGGSSPAARRVIALDWAAAETLVALGGAPIAAAEIGNYDLAVVSPAMPKDVIDVGLRLSPNPELMQALDADLILIDPAQVFMRSFLERFAPIETMDIYGGAGQPYPLARDATKKLAGFIGREGAASALLAEADAVMLQARMRLGGYDGRALYIIGFIGGDQIAVAGRRSLFQGVLDEIGLRNAFPAGRDDDWGTAYAAIEDLVAAPEARVVCLSSPASESARRGVMRSTLWRHLPFVREQRVVTLPAIFPFGALPSAMRFAEVLAAALTDPADQSDARL